jgi:ubiquitin carboxyl-terminal hydrolase 10
LQPDSVHTIQDALLQVSRPQPLQVGQSGSNEASQQVLLEALPPVLVVHLKRILYDSATDGTNKTSKPVRFAPELEIPPGTIFPIPFSVSAKAETPRPEIMAPVAEKSAESVNYKLYGVLYRHGKSACSGHYTIDVLHSNGDSSSGGTWLHIDDEAVSEVRHEEMFGGHGNEQWDDRCAYMLFYCRTAPNQT